MPVIKHHNFRGKRFHIDIDSTVQGWCDTPEDKKMPAIRIFKKTGNNRESLEIILHEALHACFPDLPEGDIEPTALDISKFLWRLGFRKPNED